MYAEQDYLLLSGIQHFAFCRSQWALVHIDQQWSENLRTVEGMFMHEKAHEATTEKRGDVIITRGLQVFSRSLGIRGTCDVVELHRDENGVSIYGRTGKYSPVPVEYKRGKPKDNDADALQLCAQAMCLEEMLVCHIPHGYLFYGETRRRTDVALDDSLRKHLTDILKEMHSYYQRGYTPKVKPGKACKACSLADICVPKLGKSLSASEYINASINEDV